MEKKRTGQKTREKEIKRNENNLYAFQVLSEGSESHFASVQSFQHNLQIK